MMMMSTMIKWLNSDDCKDNHTSCDAAAASDEDDDGDGTVGCSFVVILFQYAVYPQQHVQHTHTHMSFFLDPISSQWIFQSCHVPLGFVRNGVGCSECIVCSSHLKAKWP